MAYSVNKVIILGNMGKDPELRSTPQGRSVCTFSIATSERYLDKNSNEWKENTDWHSIVAWDKLADRISQYGKKGSKLYVEGSLKHRQYEGKDGVTRYITEVLAREIVFLDKVEGGGGNQSYSSKSYDNQPSKSYTNVADDDIEFDGSPTPDDEVPF
ncbi:single-stranded DNA-binding protein [Candidatus Kapaibacterium sp.]